MDASQIYILTSVIILLVIAAIVIFARKNSKKKKQETITPLAGIAFGFILLGILFSDSRLIGYSLMGIGIILAVVDIVVRMKKRK